MFSYQMVEYQPQPPAKNRPYFFPIYTPEIVNDFSKSGHYELVFGFD